MGAGKTLSTNEDTAYTFATADFGLNGPERHARERVGGGQVTTLPAVGSLSFDGVAVAANDFVAAADIAAGKLKFFPAANGNGAGYASFDFRVQDNGGTANGGDDLADTANTITVDVVSVNDAPLGADKTVSTNETRRTRSRRLISGSRTPATRPRTRWRRSR